MNRSPVKTGDDVGAFVLGEDYDKAAEIRDWLRHHPQRSTLLAYLNDTQKPE